MGPYARADYNLTLCRIQSQLNTCTIGNPMPETTLSSSQKTSKVIVFCSIMLQMANSLLMVGQWGELRRDEIRVTNFLGNEKNG